MKHRFQTLILSALFCAASNAMEVSEWKQQAGKQELNADAIAQLGRDRILVTEKTYKQVFSVYLSAQPHFITSDALLNAYHVLYEESITRLENTNASRLPGFLDELYAGLDNAGDSIHGNELIATKALKRAKLVSGIALRLLDCTFEYGNDELDSIITDEVRRITGAKGKRMPEWLGEPSDDFMGIDYNRYKPRGFYTGSERLSRYYRAVSWLHSIPFRIDRTDELVAFLMLNETANFIYEHELIDYSRLLGQPDNLDIFHQIYFGNLDLSGSELISLQAELREKAKHNQTGRINDRIPSLRILSAHQTPDAILFRLTAGKKPSPSLRTRCRCRPRLRPCETTACLYRCRHPKKH